jgi:hypothetical protein
MFFTLLLQVFVGVAAIADDRSEYSLLSPPAIVELKVAEDSSIKFCVAAFRISQDSKNIQHQFTIAGPDNSCPSAPEAYEANHSEKVRLESALSTLDGNVRHSEVIDGKHWKYHTFPSAMLVALKDEKSGTEVWNAFCLVTLRLDSKRHPGEVEYRHIVFKRSEEPRKIEDEQSPVTCGDLSFAVKNEYPTSKPFFIGSPEELEATKKHNPKVATKTSLPASSRANHSGKKK